MKERLSVYDVIVIAACVHCFYAADSLTWKIVIASCLLVYAVFDATRK